MTEQSTALQKFKEIEGQFVRRAEELQQILPAHIPPARFTRVVLTAVQQNRDLLLVNPNALFRACIQCAQDGLLPDGREAVLVTYQIRQGDKAGQIVISYQPMIAGIRKKVRNSGEIASWEADLVYENDVFELHRGTDPKIVHRPAMTNRGRLIAVYSVALFKSGERSSDWMTLEEVASIRTRSRSANKGPWVTDFGEMVKKTMLRRHSKALPLSAELDNLISRDDDMIDLTPRPQTPALAADPDEQEALPKPRRGRPPKLADLRPTESPEGSPPLAPPQDTRDDPTPDAREAAASTAQEDAGGGAHYLKDAEQEGYDAYYDGKPCFPLPKAYQSDSKKLFGGAYKTGWNRARQEAADDEDAEGEGAQAE